jgi:hypothetical protein
LLTVVILSLIVVGNNTATPRHHLLSDELSHCVGMLEGECTQIDVADILGASRSVVYMAWTGHHAFGTAVR